MPQEIKVKKVKPYPFPAVIDNGGVKVPVEILLLTARGFISRPTTKAIFQVGGSCKAEFELPVLKYQVLSPLRVIKTYDRVVEKDQSVERLVEFHFDQPGAALVEVISKFMMQIGQK